MVRLPGRREPAPDPALGRPAPARGARPRDRQPPARAAARRAARRARPEAAPGDAARAEVDPARAERAHHLHLRHPRPGRGADDERPHRGLLRRAHRAGGHARARSTSAPSTSSWPASSAPRTSSSATAGALLVRPEKIRMLADGEARRGGARGGRARGRLPRLGHALRGRVRTAAQTLIVLQTEPRHVRRARRWQERGRRVRLAWREEDASVLHDSPTTHERGGRESDEACEDRLGAGGLVLAAMAVAVSACGSSSSSTAASNLPTSIGAGEGQLNLVAWEGYAQPEWVKPFEKQTGCMVHAKYAGLLRRNGDADAPGRRQPVRHGLRLRRRQPAPDPRRRTSRR